MPCPRRFNGVGPAHRIENAFGSQFRKEDGFQLQASQMGFMGQKSSGYQRNPAKKQAGALQAG